MITAIIRLVEPSSRSTGSWELSEPPSQIELNGRCLKMRHMFMGYGEFRVELDLGSILGTIIEEAERYYRLCLQSR